MVSRAQQFWTADRLAVPEGSVGQMREADRIAVDGFGLGVVTGNGVNRNAPEEKL